MLRVNFANALLFFFLCGLSTSSAVAHPNCEDSFAPAFAEVSESIGSRTTWNQAFETLRTSTSHRDHQDLVLQILKRLPYLTPFQTARLTADALHHYRLVPKEPSRRSFEVLLSHLKRYDLEFHRALKLEQSSNSNSAAYLATHELVRRDFGSLNSFSGRFLLEESHRIRLLLPRGAKVYIYGSAASGKSIVGKSDIDVAFVFPTWMAKLNLEERALNGRAGPIATLLLNIQNKKQNSIQRELENEISRSAHQLYGPYRPEVQVSNITPGVVYRDGNWRAYGIMNPFVIEIQSTGVYLHVFEPPKVEHHPEFGTSFQPGNSQIFTLEE